MVQIRDGLQRDTVPTDGEPAAWAATASSPLRAPAASDGFTALWEGSGLDLSVEALVLRPEFAELLEDDDRHRAVDRLQQYRYRLDGSR